MKTLTEKRVIDALSILHVKAENQKHSGSVSLPNAERFMAISVEQGNFLYLLGFLAKAKTIVEFGCSFGISTIYLAAAAKDNGGSVITTEMEAAKWGPALDNIREAGLQDFVTLFQGDAMVTLQDVKEPIDLLFLDGSKKLYLPVFELLKERLHPGSIIFADNADHAEAISFIDYVTSANDRFVTASLFDGRSIIIYVV